MPYRCGDTYHSGAASWFPSGPSSPYPGPSPLPTYGRTYPGFGSPLPAYTPPTPMLLPQQRLFRRLPGPAPALPQSPTTPRQYFASVALARDIVRRSHCAEHAGRVEDWGSRFDGYLRDLPPPYGPRYVMGACPEDVLTFCTSVVIPEHGRTPLTDGTVVPAFSTLKGVLTCLLHHFDGHGRRGEWEPLRLWGNPCESTEVRDFRTGYERLLWQEGVEPIAAEPITEAAVHSLVDAADAARGELRALHAKRAGVCPRDILRELLCERDATYYLYLWESVQRGGEGGRLRPCDLQSAASDSAPSGPVPQYAHPVLVRPNGCKSRQRRDCGSFTLERPHANTAYCFITRVNRFLKECHMHGHYAGADGHIFRPRCGARHDRFSDDAMGSSASLKRLEKHSRSALPRGQTTGNESCHSFRRGAMQARRARGDAPADTMRDALISSPGVYKLYTDQERPTKRRRR